MVSSNNKQRAAAAAAELITDGMILGLGTGTTASYLVQILGERVRQGLRIQGVPTSEATRQLADSGRCSADYPRRATST
jgi:ribose 5-phosphate isomerase A